ncbi:MAG: hypothetical protein NTV21_04550 [Planctomycetota bacterium]|nr:hypothetical protein [Planctomycetota bacterium]
MNSLAEIFVVLAALYAYECSAWVPRSALALRAFAKALRRARPSSVVGSPEAGALVLQPLPWFGTLLVSEAWPIALSPLGIATREPLELDRRQRRPFEPLAWRWEELGPFTARERNVFAGEQLVASSNTLRGAREIAGLLEEVAHCPKERRASEIERLLARSFDPTEFARRTGALERVARPLRVWCTAVFVWLALVCPALAFGVGLALTWPYLVAGIVVLQVATVWTLRRSVRGLLPDCDEERGRATLALALSPVAAARAVDTLSRPLLAGLQPLACTATLPREERDELARASFVDALHPRQLDDAPPLALEVDAWFRARLASALRKCAGELAIDADALLAPPPADSGERSWCPRCRTRFDTPPATCFDCSVATLPLAPSP